MTKKNKENFINFFGGKNKDDRRNDNKRNDDNKQNSKNSKNGKVCNLTGDIKEKRKKFSKDIDELSNKIKNQANKNIKDGTRKFNFYTKEYPRAQFNRFKYLILYYWNRRYGGKISQRPDLMFLYDIIFGILFFYIVHQVIFKLLPIIKPKLIPIKLISKLKKISPNDVDQDLINKAKNKMHAIKSHDSYFRIQPFGQFTEGDKMTMQYASILMQIMLNLFIFVILPLIIVYIVWLFIKYTQVLIKASIGFFKTMFRFFFRLVKAAASRKWLIRTVMGWGIVRYPKLGKEHLIPWKKKYIDYWIDRETLRYRILFYKIREKYYYRPKRKYIEIPWANLKREFFRLKKIYIDLTAKEFWIQVIRTYPEFVTKPENELYLQLYGLDALRKKYYEELKQDIENKRLGLSKAIGKCTGAGYESKTRITSKKCMCPAGEPHSCGAAGEIASDVKGMADSIDEQIVKGAAKNISKLADAASDCGTYDDIGKGITKGYSKSIAKFPVFIFWVICLITGVFVALIAYVKFFGVPNWMVPLIAPEYKLAYINGNKVAVRKKKLLASILGV